MKSSLPITFLIYSQHAENALLSASQYSYGLLVPDRVTVTVQAIH
jgi:hypothetical protein